MANYQKKGYVGHGKWPKNKGKKFSVEWRKKMSEAKKGNRHFFFGKHHSEETKLKSRLAHLGKKHSEETKRKMSESQRGANNPMWRGGVTPINMQVRKSAEYKLCQIAVFIRDHRLCIWCGSKSNIEADHIKPFALFPELRFAIDNGRTLCHDCHKKTSTYGNHKR